MEIILFHKRSKFMEIVCLGKEISTSKIVERGFVSSLWKGFSVINYIIDLWIENYLGRTTYSRKRVPNSRASLCIIYIIKSEWYTRKKLRDIFYEFGRSTLLRGGGGERRT